MPPPDAKAPRAGQDSLFEPTADPRAGIVLRGRHSEAVDRALSAARDRQMVDDVDEALATLVRAGAWSLDAFEAQNKPYGPSKIVPAITEALRELLMTPDARKSAVDDEIGQLLSNIAALDSESNDDASISHRED